MTEAKRPEENGKLFQYVLCETRQTGMAGLNGWINGPQRYFDNLQEALDELAKPYPAGVIDRHVQFFDIILSNKPACDGSGWRWNPAAGQGGRWTLATRKRKQPVKLTKRGRALSPVH